MAPRFFTPDSLDKTLYATRRETYTGTENKVRPPGVSPQYHTYKDATAVREKKEGWEQPANVLDRVWIDNKIRWNWTGGIKTDAWINRHANVLRVDTRDPQSFFHTLNSTVDPVDYIHMLTLWPLFGLNLAPFLPEGSGPINYTRHTELTKNDTVVKTQKYDPKKLPGLREYHDWKYFAKAERKNEKRDFYFNYKYDAPLYDKHSFGYAQAVLNLRPLIFAMMNDLEMQITDKSIMVDEGVLNAGFQQAMATIRQMKAVVDIKNDITVTSDTGHQYYSYTYGLPIYKNFNDVQTALNDKSDIPPQAIVPVEYDGDIFSVKELIRFWLTDAVAFYESKRDVLSAKLQKVRDPKEEIEQTESLKDPSKNIRLVYDPVASEKAGKAIYTDISVLHAQYDPKPVVNPEGFDFSYEQYKKGLDYTAINRRDLYIPDMGYFSQADIDNLKDKKGGVLPWVIGGVVAAAVVTQVT